MDLTMEWIPAKSLLVKMKSPQHWFGIEYNMNIYRGCHHGCIYCDSRSSCYHVENFEQVCAKKNAISILYKELSGKRKKGIVGTGAMSDPYNRFEKKEELTRQALRLLCDHGFGAVLTTKSDLILRDADILQEIQKFSPILVSITITTPHDDLSQKYEPFVSRSSSRFLALENLVKHNIPVCLLLMPVLPFLTDKPADILEIVHRCEDIGVQNIYAGFGMTLRDGQREYFYQKLDEIEPDLSGVYQRKFGNSYHCEAEQHKKLYYLFQNECEKYHINYRMTNIIDAYQKNYHTQQLSLFDMNLDMK